MSYTALYRKFRPQEFEDVKGQDHIVTTLKNQIKADRIGHAYLFCGTRGTGKTTIAKIFAKAVNCEHPVDGSPCGECPTCKAIAAGSSMNVIEIDAASNNGVDNIRQIREEVEYRPTEGKYKVYIIDEVHMLSIGAFNALLKTLEEPPSYVIFILATTEAHKIPITILSRCQRYDFRRISIDTIAGRLTDLMEKEQVNVEERAIRYIAKAADGSMRDALSLLDQCIAFYLGQELTYEKVLETLGAVDTEVFSRLLRQILDKNVTGAIQKYYKNLKKGHHEPIIKQDLLSDIENGNFIVCLVPKVDVDTEEVVGAEAVVRYHHKDLGIMNPGKYLTLLEETKLSHYLDLYVFEVVCKTLRRWETEDLPMIPIAVNFAGATLRQIDVAEKMTALIEKYHVSCEYLEVEVSESYSDMNQEMLAETSNKIRKSNVRVILDHFGAKESTVAILTIMEFDGLKIDKSIVTNIVGNGRSQSVAKAVTDACCQLGVPVSASGVETRDQLNVLKELGCSCVQGSLFNKPITIDTFEVRYLKG